MKNFVHLGKALLCSDCTAISEGGNTCPACGSNALFGLWRFIPDFRDGVKLNTDPIPQDVIELERMVKF